MSGGGGKLRKETSFFSRKREQEFPKVVLPTLRESREAKLDGKMKSGGRGLGRGRITEETEKKLNFSRYKVSSGHQGVGADRHAEPRKGC